MAIPLSTPTPTPPITPPSSIDMDDRATSLPNLDDEEKATFLHNRPSLPAIDHDAAHRPNLSHPRHRVPRIRPLLRRTAIFLLPSFLQPTTQQQQQPPRPGPTAYLDGLRGLAALIVFFCHYLYTCFVIAPGYGASGSHYHLPLLPFVRLLFSGPPMVCLFFVVSGYALSLKPLRLIHARKEGEFTRTMASFVFRRGIRLFLPTAVSTGMIVLLVRLGLYEWTREFAADEMYMRNVQEMHYGRLDTVWEQVGDWARGLFGFVHVWDWMPFGGSTAMDVHLWTIPVEFRCSMVVFLTLVGTARLRRGWRLAVLGGLIVFVYLSQRWEMVLFYGGVVMAEMDVARGAHARGGEKTEGTLPAPGLMSPSTIRTNSPPPMPPRRQAIKRAMWTALSILGLFLMSQPDERGAETPGWVFLTSLIPEWWTEEYRYWQSCGAILFVMAVGRSRGWQRFFNSAVVQYFGKISYAIYLMHGPVLHTVGYAIERWAWTVTGIEGRAYERGFMLAAVFVVPIVIWVSDVFWRGVDAPIVQFARWLEAKCSIE